MKSLFHLNTVRILIKYSSVETKLLQYFYQIEEVFASYMDAHVISSGYHLSSLYQRI